MIVSFFCLSFAVFFCPFSCHFLGALAVPRRAVRPLSGHHGVSAAADHTVAATRVCGFAGLRVCGAAVVAVAATAARVAAIHSAADRTALAAAFVVCVGGVTGVAEGVRQQTAQRGASPGPSSRRNDAYDRGQSDLQQVRKRREELETTPS